MEEFVKNFAEQFDDTPLSAFHADTKFRDLDEWSSLTGLAVMNMIAKKYQVKLSVLDLRKADTIGDLYHVVCGK